MGTAFGVYSNEGAGVTVSDIDYEEPAPFEPVEPTVYDYADVASVEISTPGAGNVILANMPATENVAIRFNLAVADMSKGGVHIGFLQDENGSDVVWTGKGIEFKLYSPDQWAGCYVKNDSSGYFIRGCDPIAEAIYRGETVTLEIGIYDTSATTAKLYLKFNGELVGESQEFAKADFEMGTAFGVYSNGGAGVSIGGINYVAPTRYSVKYLESENGLISGINNVLEGEEVKISILPITGYKLDSLMINGESVDLGLIETVVEELNFAAYTFIPTQNTQISATFIKDENFDADEDSVITVYDYYDLSGKDKVVVDQAKKMYIFGQVEKTENVAVRLVLGVGSAINTASGAQRQIGFFEESASPIWSDSGFEICMWWENTICFRFKGAANKQGFEDVYFDVPFTPGGEVLIELGTFDIGNGKAMVYFKADNVLYLIREYDKSEYSLSTAVGGLYVDSVDDVATEDIYVRSAYETRSVAFAEDYSGKFNLDTSMVAEGRDINLVASAGYTIGKITLIDESTLNVIGEFSGSDITMLGNVYTIKVSELSAKGSQILVKLDYEYVENDVITTFDADKITFVGDAKVALGGNYSFSFTLNVGYTLISVTANGEDITNKLTVNNGEYSATVYGVNEDLEIVITANECRYSVSAEIKQGADGATVTASASEVLAGESVTFTVVVEEGYSLVKVTLNGNEVFLNVDGTYVLDNVDSNVEFVVEIEKDEQEIESSTDSEESSEESSGGCISSVNVFTFVSLILLAGAMILIRKFGKNQI